MDGAPPPALSPEQRKALERARERARVFLKAGRVAAFNVWTLGVFATFTLLFGVTSPTALLLGGALATVAFFEHRGRIRLREFDPAGPRLLARNQLTLMAVIVVYALWRLWKTQTAPDPALQQMDDLLGGDTAGLVQELTTLVYVAVIALTVLFQGLMARYYKARVNMVRAYLQETPDWVVELQRSATLD